jgi:hypothetical protein
VLTGGLNHTSGLVCGRTGSHESRETTKKEFKKGILPLFDFWYFYLKKSTPSFFFSARRKTRAAKAARFFFISP